MENDAQCYRSIAEAGADEKNKTVGENTPPLFLYRMLFFLFKTSLTARTSEKNHNSKSEEHKSY